MPGSGSRFTAPSQTTDQRLSTNVVGLVELSDFRKRRAEVLEQQEREARGGGSDSANGANGGKDGGAATSDAGAAGPGNDTGAESETGAGTGAANTSEADTDRPANKKAKTKDGKKKKKGGKATKLSFLGDDNEDGEEEEVENVPKRKDTKRGDKKDEKDEKERAKDTTIVSRTPSGLPPIKSFTQQARRKQEAEREALRKEFQVLQDAVKASPVAIPFVFYEGANLPGGVVSVKKGDPVWLFLDRSRKVGARLGVGEKKASKARLHWARINVDDLMLVRGNLIIPHHYTFYFFLINKTLGPGGERVFDYISDSATPQAAPAPLTTTLRAANNGNGNDDNDIEEDFSHLEGAGDDPSLTKVVDRRWYERNKHIYPASLWQEFDPEEDYVNQVRRDQGGNAFFFAAK
ncbi:hypothetical protein SCUCBS95973_000827 [Sporothrix curviconia]|uniref:FAM50A/XAP5 C-terminal domain-containing protein n=1 Tax=Sporothrix curviconia TaxID=1260050 RepID=A0ABP0ATF8_9PEZI